MMRQKTTMIEICIRRPSAVVYSMNATKACYRDADMIGRKLPKRSGSYDSLPGQGPCPPRGLRILSWC